MFLNLFVLAVLWGSAFPGIKLGLAGLSAPNLTLLRFAVASLCFVLYLRATGKRLLPERRDVPRFSSRPLDIDVVFFDDLVLDGPGHLQLPRPELQHAFVLRPLADIAPDFVHPLSGLTLGQLWQQHPDCDDPLVP